MRSNYRLKVQSIAGQTSERAVYAILSQGGAMAQTMVPIDTSTLINSQYAPQIQSMPGRVRGHIGYTAEYAFAVHQASGRLAGEPRAGGNGRYWDPNAEPEFMTKGFEQIKPSVPQLLKAIYRV